MKSVTFEKEKIKLTPDEGFNLVGIDYFAETGNQLYLIKHYDMYQDALTAKKKEKILRSISYYTRIRLTNIFVVKKKIVKLYNFLQSIFITNYNEYQPMTTDASDIIETLYENQNKKINSEEVRSFRKSPQAKYQIFDEDEFTRGRKVLGDMIVHGMMTSGGTDLDWLIEHNGCFLIFEFKGFHNDKINIPIGQMIAYEKLHEKLNNATKCFLYIVGCDDIDFTDPDAKIWVFEMSQWKNGAIPKNTSDIYEDEGSRRNKYIIFREYFDEMSVEKLRELVDNHWNEFESSIKGKSS